MSSVNKQIILMVKALPHVYCGQQVNIILLHISCFLLFQLFIGNIEVTIIISICASSTEVPVTVHSIAERTFKYVAADVDRENVKF